MLGVFFGAVSLLVLFNLVVDPYDFFRLGPWKGSGLTNERLWKLQYLDDHRGKYNGFYVGSSTTSQIYPRDIKELRPDLDFYNLGVANGVPSDYEIILRYLLGHGHKPKQVVVQLDVKVMWNYWENEQVVYKEFGPDVTGESPLSFYGAYLLRFHMKGAKAKVLYHLLNFPPGPHESYDRSTGVFTFDHEELLIKEDHFGFMTRYDVADDRLKRGKRQPTTLTESLQALQRMVDVCKSYHVPLTIVLAPPNDSLMNEITFKDMSSMIRGMARIYPFWDFTGYNSVTLDDRLYYDLFHTRPTAAKRMVKKIFGKGPVDPKDDFGHWVDEKNVERRLARLRREFEWADSVFSVLPPRKAGDGFKALEMYLASDLAPDPKRLAP